MDTCEVCGTEAELFHNDDLGLALCEDCDLSAQDTLCHVEFTAKTGHHAGIIAKQVEDLINRLNGEYQECDFEEA